jgi:hypothetical protein
MAAEAARASAYVEAGSNVFGKILARKRNAPNSKRREFHAERKCEVYSSFRTWLWLAMESDTSFSGCAWGAGGGEVVTSDSLSGALWSLGDDIFRAGRAHVG